MAPKDSSAMAGVASASCAFSCSSIGAPATFDSSVPPDGGRARHASARLAMPAWATAPLAIHSPTAAPGAASAHLTRVLPASISSMSGVPVQPQGHVARADGDAALRRVEQQAARVVDPGRDTLLLHLALVEDAHLAAGPGVQHVPAGGKGGKSGALEAAQGEG